MRSVVSTIAWEFWSANRRGWLILLAAIPTCAIIFHAASDQIHRSEAMQAFIFLPFVASVIQATAFCNFTDPTNKSRVAGFPRHLFTRPVNTRLMVAIVMGCAMLSVAGIYVAWAKLVYGPLGIVLFIRWPVTVIATGVVLYQAIVWCLSGFRMTRVVLLSLAITILVGIAVIPYGNHSKADSLVTARIDAALTAILLLVATVAYASTVVTISLQRRGAAWGWAGGWKFIDRISDALPQRSPKLRSAESALVWFEWRRSGMLLPVAVVCAAILVVGPAMRISGHGAEATVRTAFWLAMLPVLLAFPIGKGLAKPDLWSLSLELPAFFTVRPISSSQIVAAKMKSAAWSTLIAWVALIAVAPAWLYNTSNTEHLRDIGNMFATIYSPFSLWAMAILTVPAAMLLTWSLLVGSIWLGQCGRPSVFYSLGGLSLTGYLASLFAVLIWLVDYPEARGERFMGFLPWLPWVMATLFAVKTSIACWMVWQSQRRGVVTNRVAVEYMCSWLVATGGLVLLACLVSPRVIWLRDTFILAALLVLPITRIAAAPLAVAWNRHR